MNPKTYTSAWQYFVETEANPASGQDEPSVTPGNLPLLPTGITLNISFTGSEWKTLCTQSQKRELSPEQYIKELLFTPSHNN